MTNSVFSFFTRMWKNDSDRERLMKRIDLAVCGFFFLYMLFLTAQCPYFTDDYHFKFVWLDFDPCGSDRRVTALSDILESMKNYYMCSGGRVFCHFIAYVFLFLDKWVFNVVNAAMFTALGVLLRKLMLGERREKYPALLPLIYLLLFFYIPKFGDDMIWLSGSVNYLWPTVLLLLTVYEAERYFQAPELKRLLKTCIAVFFSAFTNEITGGMLFVFWAIWIFTDRKRIVPKNFLPLICTIPGTVFVVIAPGNASRSAAIEKVSFLSTEAILSVLPKYLSALFSSAGMIFLLLAFIICFTYRLKTEGIVKAVFRARFFIAGFAGLAALAMCGAYIVRPLALPLILIAVDYGKSVLFVYDRMVNDTDRTFRRVTKKETLPPQHKKQILNAAKGSLVVLAIVLCAGLTEQTVHYIRKTDSIWQYEAAFRESILTEGKEDRTTAAQLYNRYFTDFASCGLYPFEAALAVDKYQCGWFVLYCRSEEG